VARKTFESLLETLEQGIGAVRTRPSLLYGPEDLDQLRARAVQHPELCDRIAAQAAKLVQEGDLSLEPGPYYALSRLQTLISAQMLRPSPPVEEFILRFLRALGEAETWVCHVHPGMKCDHCASNVASNVVQAMEALGPALSRDDEQWISERVHARCLNLFLECCRERSEFWSQREHGFNWRIMTCGESGLAALGVECPDRDEIVKFALEGVADILDRVPPDGDWEEGPGYWGATLLFGLRFALALRRATEGRIDLFTHPALRATADYFTCITLPDGSVFNYADNSPRISPTVMHLLARALGCGHLAWTARRIGHQSAADLLFDDPSLESQEPGDELKTRVFATTGVAVAREDWSEDAMYAALKSGPTAVGHSHLDIQSFIVWKGAPLIVDSGYWPYASFLGFFDSAPGGKRWDFDSNASVGHNTVLVDGQGQTCSPECAGRIIASGAEEGLSFFVSEAADAYPGLVTKFRRWLVYVPPDVLLVYDELASDSARHWEWLLHAGGALHAERVASVIENEGVQLSLTRLLPEADMAWRNVRETRTSHYFKSDSLEDTEQVIEVQRFGPMLPTQEVEFLWAMHLGAPESVQWEVARREEGAFTVSGLGEGHSVMVRLDREALLCALA